MTRKRCKRKVYAHADTLTLAIEGAAVTTKAALDKLRARELSAIEAFIKGQARMHEWRDMCDMLNIAETMARAGIGPEALAACQSAEQHLMDAAQRFGKTQQMGLTGPGIQALRDLFEFHDLQRQSVCRSQYEKAIAKTRNRLQSRAPGVIELNQQGVKT